MTDIFREVDEEVRQDKALEFWQKYQGLVLAVALLIVAGAGAWQYWVHQKNKAAQEAGAKYETALQLSRDGKGTEAEAALADLAKTGPAGYASIAKMRAAAELGARDAAAGAKAFDAVSVDSTVSSVLQDVAKLRAAMLRIDTADKAEIESRLTPLAAAGQPFRNAARELLGLAALKRDDLDTAGRWLDQIVVDSGAPAGTRRRAEALLGVVRAGKPAAK